MHMTGGSFALHSLHQFGFFQVGKGGFLGHDNNQCFFQIRLSKTMDMMSQRLEARHVPALSSHPRPCPRLMVRSSRWMGALTLRVSQGVLLSYSFSDVLCEVPLESQQLS